MKNDLILAELESALANLIRIGVIESIDFETKTVSVKTGNLEVSNLPFFARAGSYSEWNPPQLGEQVVIFSPSGILENGIVLAGLYQNKFPAPGDSSDKLVKKYSEGHKEVIDLKEKSKETTLKKFEITTSYFEVLKDSVGFLQTISESLEIIANSKTSTMLGPQLSIDNSLLLPAKKTAIDGFITDKSTEIPKIIKPLKVDSKSITSKGPGLTGTGNELGASLASALGVSDEATIKLWQTFSTTLITHLVSKILVIGKCPPNGGELSLGEVK